jgi:acyl dehydratase
MLRFYEDYIVGAEFETPARTIGAAEVLGFADLTGDHHRLHLDQEFGRASIFGANIAHGLLGMALVNGLAYGSVIDPDYVLAFLGLSWRFVGPIRLGDTLRASIRIASRRPTSKAGQGLVVEAIRLLNQRDEVVQEGEFTFLVKSADAPPAA